MLERAVKFFFRIILVMFALLGVRYLLSGIGIFIPLEWFVIMGAGMMGFYGVLVIILFAVMIYSA